MELKIEDNIEDIHKISSNEFNVNEVNSIQRRYKEWRQLSKSPTFALT